MQKTKKQELLLFLIITGISIFFRFYKLDIFPPGFQPQDWPLRIFSSTMGVLTVIGLYFLAKELFEWRLAAIASFLTAISYWHVNFSRMGSATIFIPFILVYSFYFLWKGIKKSHQPDFFLAGIFWGLGFYNYTSCIASIIVIILFINYWWYLKKDFNHAKYEFAKTKLLQGFVLFALTAFVIALPAGIYFWQNGVFASVSNISLSNIVRTLGMFNFTGDLNPAHNIPGSPMLPWPIGVFFVIGFINEIIHWLRRKHDHFSTVHTLLFAWFFVMLIPGFLSASAPDALLTIGVLPIVMVFSARGIWWFFEKLMSWYSLRDAHIHEAHAVTALVLIVFLFSIGFMEYWRYFVK